MTCTENGKNLTRPEEHVKQLTRCPECGSEETGTGAKHNWAGELEVGWECCHDCGHQWNVG